MGYLKASLGLCSAPGQGTGLRQGGERGPPTPPRAEEAAAAPGSGLCQAGQEHFSGHHPSLHPGGAGWALLLLRPRGRAAWQEGRGRLTNVLTGLDYPRADAVTWAEMNCYISQSLNSTPNQVSQMVPLLSRPDRSPSRDAAASAPESGELTAGLGPGGTSVPTPVLPRTSEPGAWPTGHPAAVPGPVGLSWPTRDSGRQDFRPHPF